MSGPRAVKLSPEAAYALFGARRFLTMGAKQATCEGCRLPKMCWNGALCDRCLGKLRDSKLPTPAEAKTRRMPGL